MLKMKDFEDSTNLFFGAGAFRKKNIHRHYITSNLCAGSWYVMHVKIWYTSKKNL